MFKYLQYCYSGYWHTPQPRYRLSVVFIAHDNIFVLHNAHDNNNSLKSKLNTLYLDVQQNPWSQIYL